MLRRKTSGPIRISGDNRVCGFAGTQQLHGRLRFRQVGRHRDQRNLPPRNDPRRRPVQLHPRVASGAFKLNQWAAVILPSPVTSSQKIAMALQPLPKGNWGTPRRFRASCPVANPIILTMAIGTQPRSVQINTYVFCGSDDRGQANRGLLQPPVFLSGVDLEFSCQVLENPIS